MEIRPIPAHLTWDIRHKVMWPLKPISYVKLKEDEKGLHFGVYLEDTLVSVISLFINGTEAQFRKFATLVAYQGNGYGFSLLSYVFKVAYKNKIKRIWCNARIDKNSFYERFQMKSTPVTFEKSTIKYVIMEHHFKN